MAGWVDGDEMIAALETACVTPAPRILVVSRRKGDTRAPEGAVVVYDVATDPDDVLGGTGGGSAPNGSDERAVGGDRLVEWCERSGDTLALECLAA